MQNLQFPIKFGEASRPLLFPFGLGDPEGFVGPHQVGKDSAALEDHMLALWRIIDPDLDLGLAVGVTLEDALGVEGAHVLLQTSWETRVHGGAAREDNVLVELGTKVDIGCLDGLKEDVRKTGAFAVYQGRIEQDLRRFKPFLADPDAPSIGQLQT